MFENLVVDRRCAQKIENSVKAGRLSHAVILEGADSETRLAAAKEIAKALVCKGENKPCGVCASCRKADSGSHPDIHFLFKEESSASIKVDEIRSLRQKAMLLPNDGDRTVFIIHEAQYMNPQAQNALLKIFEEPSPHICFILTCNTKSAFLDTIVSRASDYYLASERDNAADSENIAAAAEKASVLIKALCNLSEFDFLCQTGEFQKDKSLFAATLGVLSDAFRDALIIKNGNKASLLSKCENEALLLSQTFTEKKLLAFIESTQTMIDAVNAAANHNLLITRLCSVFYDIKLN